MAERYYKLSDDTVKMMEETISKFANSTIKVEYDMVGDTKLKSLIDVKKIPDNYAFTMKKDAQIIINEDLLNEIEDDSESVEILLREALTKVVVNGETGKIKMDKPNIITFDGILDKYTPKTVLRAKELQKLTLDQLKDKELDNKNDIDISQ